MTWDFDLQSLIRRYRVISVDATVNEQDRGDARARALEMVRNIGRARRVERAKGTRKRVQPIGS